MLHAVDTPVSKGQPSSSWYAVISEDYQKPMHMSCSRQLIRRCEKKNKQVHTLISANRNRKRYTYHAPGGWYAGVRRTPSRWYAGISEDYQQKTIHMSCSRQMIRRYQKDNHWVSWYAGMNTGFCKMGMDFLLGIGASSLRIPPICSKFCPISSPTASYWQLLHAIQIWMSKPEMLGSQRWRTTFGVFRRTERTDLLVIHLGPQCFAFRNAKL